MATPKAKYASCFSEGKGVVYTSEKKVYGIDKAGTVLFEKELSKEPVWEETNLSWKSAFHDGRAVVIRGQKFGVLRFGREAAQ